MLPSDIHTSIQTFLSKVCVIDMIFIYLYENNKELYILIAGPTTWERRMEKITELLLQFVDDNCSTDASTCLYTEDNKTTLSEDNKTTLSEDIIYLYQSLINDIIEYNKYNNLYAIEGNSIKPNQTLKNIFYILIKTLEQIRWRTCIEFDIPFNFEHPSLNDDEIVKIRNEMSSMHNATSAVISYIISIKKLRKIIYKKINFFIYN